MRIDICTDLSEAFPPGEIRIAVQVVLKQINAIMEEQAGLRHVFLAAMQSPEREQVRDRLSSLIMDEIHAVLNGADKTSLIDKRDALELRLFAAIRDAVVIA
jgi:hypothetical protein